MFLTLFLVLGSLVMIKFHIFRILVCLEILTVSVFSFMVFFIFGYRWVIFIIIFIVIVVCEAALGLSLVVLSVRLNGSDIVQVH